MPFRDQSGYYESLLISPDASPGEIQKQYHRLAKVLHPDVSTDPADAEQFYRISEAYNVLKSPSRRAEYDIESAAADQRAEIEFEQARERERLLNADIEQLKLEAMAEIIDRPAADSQEAPPPQGPADVLRDQYRLRHVSRRQYLAQAAAAAAGLVVVGSGLGLLFKPSSAPDSPFLLAKVAPEKKVAIVIGNSSYLHAPTLRNAARDATAIHEQLKSLGFQSELGVDQTKAQIKAKFAWVRRKIASGGVFVFYYAGHGIQIDGKNYMVPVEAEMPDIETAKREGVDILELVTLSSSDAYTVVMLDACRDNPFADGLATEEGLNTGRVGRGLVSMAYSGMALYAFATSPGEVAKDGAGDHSPFATALLHWLGRKDLEANQLMTRVKADVFEATEGRQTPWHDTNFRRDVFLGRGDPFGER